jgi:hypothetical protein
MVYAVYGVQLFEEWEYHFSSFSVQSVKYVMARNLMTAYSEPASLRPCDPSSLSHTTINKFNNQIVYTKLQCPHVSFDLDYTAVLHALCDVLAKLYDKICANVVYT